MELLDILDKIKKESAIAQTDITSIPMAVRDGWLSRIGVAKRKVEELKSLYAQAFFNDAVPLLLSGEDNVVKGIGELLEKYQNGVYVHSDELYEVIADQVEKQMGPQRTWLMDMTNSINGYMAEIMREMGAISFVRIVPDKTSFVVKDRADLGRLIKSWIVKYNGITPSLYYLCRKIREKALKSELSAESYVVVEGLSQSEASHWAALFKKPSCFETDLKGQPKEVLSGVLQRYQDGVKNSKKPKKTTGRG